MGTQVNWGDVPDYTVLPHDIYDAAVEDVVLKFSKSGKLMAEISLSITAPAPFAGRSLRDWCVLGTDDDPEATDPETYKVSGGARKLKRYLKATGAGLDPDLEVACGNLIAQSLSVLVTQEDDDQGRKQNRISQTFPLGERIPGSLADGEPAAPARAGRPAPAPAARGGRPGAAPAARPVTTRPVAHTAPPASGDDEPQDEGVARPRTAARPTR